MKRRRFGAVAALTTAASGLHAHHPSCLAFGFPASSKSSISICRRASVHPVSFAAGDGPRTFKQPCENKRTRPEAGESSIRQSKRTTAKANSRITSTSLSAFFARGTDAPPADESKRDRNSFLRKILPLPTNNSSNSDARGVSFSSTARTAAADGRRASAATTARARTAHARTAHARTKPSPTARYYYVSPASLHEQCPSWTPGSGPIDAEECPLDDSLFVGAYEISEHLERAEGSDAAISVGMNNAASQENEEGLKQQQQKAASRLVEEALHGFIHRHALHTVSIRYI